MDSIPVSASYRRVPILRPGEYIDMDGRRVVFNAADLAQIAGNYDPGYSTAPVNIDHAEAGPALGVVRDLVWDDEYLCADLTGVDAVVADGIDAGRYPFRSAEVYADLDGNGPYLRALALLGARPPAVKGLPAMPARERAGEGTGGAGVSPAVTGWRTETSPPPKKYPHIIHIISEVYMPQRKATSGTTATAPGSATGGDPVRLAEENNRLVTENRRLRNAETRRGVAYFLAELRDAGKLTPAMEHAGVEDALINVEEQQLTLMMADGTQAPLSNVLREVLKALPNSYCASELAPPAELDPELSPEERDIAKQLGLSETEYAEIKEA